VPAARTIFSSMIAQTLLFLADAAPTTATPPSSLMNVVPFLGMGVIFYFLLLRPQQQQKKTLQSMIAGLKTGDKVVTSGGIHGLVANIKDGPTLSLKIADNVKIEVDKSAIASVVTSSSNAAPVSAIANS
jgi:preprotein translocase subunit YajC